jgi:hypothetical protein
VAVGVRNELWWEHPPGARVRTVEGYDGVVEDVHDGPSPGNETYLVALDDDQGGGEYHASELTRLDATAAREVAALDVAAAELVATHWYPELGTTLVDNPPPPLAVPRVAKVAGHHVDTPTSRRLSEMATALLTEANAESWRPDYAGEPRPYIEMGGVLARTAEFDDSCVCCGGTGEHDTGRECYRCDGSGSENESTPQEPLPCEGTLHQDSGEQPVCPVCEVPIAYDPANGWQHADGSVGHHDDSPGTASEAMRELASDTSIRPQGGWVRDLMTPPTAEYSYDWCRFREANTCFYPKGLDAEATRIAGYAVWQPVNRGRCPRTSWAQQEQCPVGAPGPEVPGGFVDATVPWSQGGQRGGVPMPGYRDPGRYAALGMLDKVDGPAQHVAMPSAKSPTHVVVDPDGHEHTITSGRALTHAVLVNLQPGNGGRPGEDPSKPNWYVKSWSGSEGNATKTHRQAQSEFAHWDPAPPTVMVPVRDLREQHTATADAQHDVLYHITDNPHFSLDPTRHPENNTTLGGEWPHPGLFVSRSPEAWVNGHGYVRPYVAEIHVPKGRPGFGGYSGEDFIHADDFDKVRVNRVIPLDAHAREEYGSPGWIEEHHGTAFDTGAPIESPGMGAPVSAYYPYRGYRYDGPDVRDMKAGQHAQHKQRALDYLRDNRGWGDEDIEALKQTWASVQEPQADVAGPLARVEETAAEIHAIAGLPHDRARTAAGPQQRFFHVTSPSNRAGISQQGLLPASDLFLDEYEPGEHHGDASSVWFHGLHEEPGVGEFGEGNDVWELTHPALYDLEEDSNYENGAQNPFYRATQVAPEHLRLVSQGRPRTAAVQDDTPAEVDQDAAYRHAYSYGTQSGDDQLAHAFAAWYVQTYAPYSAPPLDQLPDPAEVWDAFTGQTAEGQGVTGALAAARVMQPEEYRRLTFPDWPGQDLPGIALTLRDASPEYYQLLHDDVAANGVQTKVLLDGDRVMDGHHRLSVADALGIPVPVGDYNDYEGDYTEAMDSPTHRQWGRIRDEMRAEHPGYGTVVAADHAGAALAQVEATAAAIHELADGDWAWA